MADPESTGKSPAFQFYPKDFLGDEDQAAMSLAECGLYIRLLCRAWDNGSIPDDPVRIARIVGAQPSEIRRYWPAVAMKFVAHPSEQGRLVNPRLEREREKQRQFRVRATANGSRRWGDESTKRRGRMSDARKLGTHSETEWQEMVSVYRRCLRCGDSEGGLVKDHVVPIYQGGSDSITNIQPLCVRCNSQKGSDTTDHRLSQPDTAAKWLPDGCQLAALHLHLPSASTDCSPTPTGVREYVKPPKPNGTKTHFAQSPSDFSPEENRRAGNFCERYAELHEQFRHGARYVSKPNLDFLEALQLVRVWTDDARLEKLAQAFLTTDDDWVASGSRTLARFRSRASWCDERLRERGL